MIGAGFGGLGAALTLAEGGARVTLCEALKYPGGCASTFERKGWRFEAGATLLSGFARGQLFDRWIRRHKLDVETRTLDPTITLRTGSWELGIPPDRARFAEALVRLAPSPEARVRAFLDLQRRVADALWALFDDETLLPPFGASMLARHALRAPRYLPLVGLLGKPLGAVLAEHELHGDPVVRAWLDAACQITVQTDAMRAEAPFALAAVDYCFRGTRHVVGGVGALAWAVLHAAQRAGAAVRMTDPVRSLRREGGSWVAVTRRGEVRARTVIANLLPGRVRELTGLGRGDVPWLDAIDDRLGEAWSAAMLYLGIAPDAIDEPEAHHVELIDDVTRPFIEGNHVFCSVSARDERDRGPGGARTVTVSTHVPIARMRTLDDDAKGRYIAEVQSRMEATIARRAPEITRAVTFRMTASPRTFARFTGRPEGLVGGVARTAGLHHYTNLGPREAAPGLYLVGDSVFPGQSALATALGGARTAALVLRGARAALSSYV